MHIFLVTYNIMKRKVGTYGRQRKKQSFDEEFALKFHLDIGKMYISHLNIKTLRFNGHYHFRRCITHTYHFRLFLMKGGLLYEETRFQSFKKNC